MLWSFFISPWLRGASQREGPDWLAPIPPSPCRTGPLPCSTAWNINRHLTYLSYVQQPFEVYLIDQVNSFHSTLRITTYQPTLKPHTAAISRISHRSLFQPCEVRITNEFYLHITLYTVLHTFPETYLLRNSVAAICEALEVLDATKYRRPRWIKYRCTPSSACSINMHETRKTCMDANRAHRV